jgi:hypothetical protein
MKLRSINKIIPAWAKIAGIGILLGIIASLSSAGVAFAADATGAETLLADPDSALDYVWVYGFMTDIRSSRKLEGIRTTETFICLHTKKVL